MAGEGVLATLHEEVTRQGVAAEYREIWREAYPDEAVPDLD